MRPYVRSSIRPSVPLNLIRSVLPSSLLSGYSGFVKQLTIPTAATSALDKRWYYIALQYYNIFSKQFVLDTIRKAQAANMAQRNMHDWENIDKQMTHGKQLQKARYLK